MATITIELTTAAYRRLQERARRQRTSAEALSSELLETALLESSGDGTPRSVLQRAGLVAELSPRLRRRIQPGVPLDEVQSALARSGGPTLSEIVLEQRGPKV